LSGYVFTAKRMEERVHEFSGGAHHPYSSASRHGYWEVWPTVMPPAGLAAIAPTPKPPAPLMGGFQEITTHEYIERIGSDPQPSLLTRIKQFFGRVFRG
jgi:hypothetical protein